MAELLRQAFVGRGCPIRVVADDHHLLAKMPEGLAGDILGLGYPVQRLERAADHL